MTKSPSLAFSADYSAERALAMLRQRLANKGVAGAALEARCLLEAACGFNRASLVARGNHPLGDAAPRLARLATRRLAGEPLARILGTREFWGFEFQLSNATLVPRPETETLVEAVLRHCQATQGRQNPWRILDLGTGSGCIGVSLLAELPNATLIGTDRSIDALLTARTNAKHHGSGERARFIAGDWAKPIRAEFDIVVSNPPYVATGDLQGLAIEVRDHDPHLALDGGADGLDAYRALAKDLPRILAKKGRVFLEIGAGQLGEARSVLETFGLTSFSSHADLAGIDRVIGAEARYPSATHACEKAKGRKSLFEKRGQSPTFR